MERQSGSALLRASKYTRRTMPARPSAATPFPRVLERLLEARKITREQYESAAVLWRRDGGYAEEILIDNGTFGEADLLKTLASLYKTRFVSTEKLSRAVIDRSTLDLLPRKLAEHNMVCPVLLDRKTGALSLVGADPDDLNAIEEIKMATRLREVQVLVARPAAVGAAIAKYYGGDERPFRALARKAAEALMPTVDPFVRNQQTPSRFVPPPHGALSAGAQRDADPPPIELDGADTHAVGSPPKPPEAKPAAASASVPPHPGPGPSLEMPRAPIVDKPLASLSAPAPRGSTTPPVPGESWMETLHVLVSLLENNRPDLRGHSAQVGRLTRKLGERIGLTERETDLIVAAALLHDLGKASSYHLTSLNVAEYEGHRVAAKKAHLTPTRLMDQARLGDITAKTLTHMYERFDGKGFPDGQAGKDIPLGARVLAITDTYSDLTQNPRNPFRKTLRPREAIDVLTKFKGEVFDPNLVDIFRHVVTGDDLKAKLLENRNTALLIDPDPEETTVLELRMIEQGIEVKIARSADQALKLLGELEVQMVVSEVELQPFDGFELLEKARQTENGKDAVWVFLSSRSDRDTVNRGFELGAADYVLKPAKAEILVAKIRKLVEQGALAHKQVARGVSGSLEEMGLPELVQILAQGRKTGALRIKSGQDVGEIHFVNGDIWNASFGKEQTEKAIYAMIQLRAGEFALDPNFKADTRKMQASAEGLLLEGMRLMDERGGSKHP